MQIKSFLKSEAPGYCLHAELHVASLILFDLDFQLRIRGCNSGKDVYSHHIRQQGVDITWLPRGSYQLTVKLEDLDLPEDVYYVDLLAWSNVQGKTVLHDESTLQERLTTSATTNNLNQVFWNIKSLDETCNIGDLSWNRQHENWFFRHFDHAPRVVINMMFDDSPQLHGKILDVGCGDGIIDLAIFLRCQPELLIGIDPFKGYEQLPEIAAKHHLPAEALEDSRLQFKAVDGNDLPWPDDFFDVVLSWGSLEHIAGGYRKTLQEIQRVLKPGGLFFIHPGLFYGSQGNHLGEFFDDPYIHLKLSRNELHERVLAAQPTRMDRSGHHASVQQYWQWYTELNPITVTEFEKELRDMNFEPWRVAVRNNELVEYTAELQKHSFTELATSEVYISVINKK